MTVLRLNPGTAMPTVRQFAADLLNWVGEAESAGVGGDLRRGVQAVQAACDDRSLEVEVHLGRTEAEAARLASAIGAPFESVALLAAASDGTPLECPRDTASRDVRLWIRPRGAAQGWPVGRPVPPVLVVENLDEYEGVLGDRPVLVVVGGNGSPGPGLDTGAWLVESLQRPGEETLLERLSRPPWDGAADVLRACSAAGALDALTAAFSLLLEQEDRGIKVKRALAQQRAGKIQQRGGTATGSDLVADVRSRVQRQFSEFERGLNERATGVFTPGSGALWRAAEERIAALAELERTPLTKVDRLRVPAPFREDLVAFLRERIATHAQQDLQQMAEMYRVVAKDVERSLQAAGAPPLDLTFDAMRDGALARLLDNALAFQKEYAGELPRSGFYEYAMAARRYQMMFFLLFSSFGLSFLRNLREFMIPFSIVLLSFGAYRIAVNVSKERVESTARELEKARESLRSDVRRILTDAQRAWTGAVGQHLQVQIPLALANVESVLREHASRRAAEGAEEKQRVQRQLQGIENVERKLQAVTRGRDAVAKAVAQVRGELKQLLATTLRPPAPPGAGPRRATS